MLISKLKKYRDLIALNHIHFNMFSIDFGSAEGEFLLSPLFYIRANDTHIVFGVDCGSPFSLDNNLNLNKEETNGKNNRIY